MRKKGEKGEKQIVIGMRARGRYLNVESQMIR
jgi:hypothetical protein